MISTLCNFLNSCNSYNKNLIVVESHSGGLDLVVEIQAPSILYTKIDTDLSIYGLAGIMDRNGSLEVNDVNYYWLLLDQNDVPIPSVQSISKNPLEFLISKYSLQNSNKYFLTLNAYYKMNNTNNMISNSASISIIVEQSNLLCNIYGSNDLFLKPFQEILIDASSSYDPNIHMNDRDINNFDFSFDCIQTKPSLLSFCDISVIQNINEPSVFTIQYPIDKYIGFKSYEIEIQMKYKSGIMVSNNIPRCSKFVYISTTNISAPILNIITDPGPKFNIEQRLVIDASIEYELNNIINWNIIPALPSNIQIPMNKDAVYERYLIPKNGLTKKNLQLALNPMSLAPNTLYTFSLECLSIDGITTSTSINVLTNSPPIPGLFQIFPPSGVALHDEFHFIATNWYDEDLPLTYDFSYTSFTASLSINSTINLNTNNNILPLQSRSLSNRVKTMLPLGDVLAFIQIYDTYDAISIAESNYIKVLEGSSSTDNNTDNANSLSTYHLLNFTKKNLHNMKKKGET